MNRPITDAELKALRALHRWLHQNETHDCDLIDACADFHEEQSERTCNRLEKRWSPFERLQVSIPENVFPLRRSH